MHKTTEMCKRRKQTSRYQPHHLTSFPFPHDFHLLEQTETSLHTLHPTKRHIIQLKILIKYETAL